MYRNVYLVLSILCMSFVSYYFCKYNDVYYVKIPIYEGCTTIMVDSFEKKIDYDQFIFYNLDIFFDWLFQCYNKQESYQIINELRIQKWNIIPIKTNLYENITHDKSPIYIGQLYDGNGGCNQYCLETLHDYYIFNNKNIKSVNTFIDILSYCYDDISIHNLLYTIQMLR